MKQLEEIYETRRKADEKEIDDRLLAIPPWPKEDIVELLKSVLGDDYDKYYKRVELN